MSETKDVKAKAVLTIQKYFRRYRARLEVRRRTAWVIYKQIEYSGEVRHNQMYRFLQDIRLHYAKAAENDKTHSDAELAAMSVSSGKKFCERMVMFGDKDDQQLLKETAYEGIPVDSSYSGARLDFPLKVLHVHEMIKHFKAGRQLHPKYLLQLLHETRLFLKTKPNISRVSTNISNQVTVVGDLHGHMDDLMIIFDKNGLPDITNPYVFNGNFVDRGPKSVELVSLLFACMLVWPTAVFLNRGNHEDSFVNAMCKFQQDWLSQYGRRATPLATLFKDLFSWLPLATIINDRIFVVQGGVSDKVDLKVIERLERHKYKSIAYLLANPSQQESRAELDQIVNVLMNDPCTKPGSYPNEKRGAGYYFGPDLTAKFLQRHNLSMLVRSHESIMEGYEYCHKKSVLTVFSASNYYSPDTNYGAYVKFDRNGQANIVQYVALSAGKAPKEPLRKRVAKVEHCAVRALRERIAASHTELEKRFKSEDSENLGAISRPQWCSVMGKVLGQNFPWMRLVDLLTEGGRHMGTVKYMTTFNKLEIQHRLGDVSSSVVEQLYCNKENLEEIFCIMDKDNSGCVSLDEFKECCQILCQATGRKMSESEVTAMAKAVDLNKDGKIDINEFLETFRLAEQTQELNKRQKRG